MNFCNIKVLIYSTSVFQPGLVQACFRGDADEIRAIISNGEDVNCQVCQFFKCVLATHKCLRIQNISHVIGLRFDYISISR